jgi:hypothetical protein
MGVPNAVNFGGLSFLYHYMVYCQIIVSKPVHKGLQLITGIKKNMKNYLKPLMDKILLRKRILIETLFSILKEEFNIQPNKNRLPVNFLVSFNSALIAYQIKYKTSNFSY